MSTRAMYSFKDQDQEFHVYKHCDGYPSGASEAISAAVGLAWPLPRFEADEFATAFVAANKPQPLKLDCGHVLVGGDVRLMACGPWRQVAPGDLQYRYVVKANGKMPRVTAYGVQHNYESDEWSEKQLWEGPLNKVGELAEL